MNDDQWKELAAAKSGSPQQDKLLDLTQEADKHPDWYKGPCMCQTCQSDPSDNAAGPSEEEGEEETDEQVWGKGSS